MMQTRIQEFLHRRINYRLAASCILTCSLAVTTSAWAGYKPPAGQKPPTGKTTSTVARSGSCESNKGPSLTTLAPHSHVGQTVSTHPTFAWFVPGSQSYPMEFRLYQYNADGKRTKIYTASLQSQPGVMTLSPPKEQPGLSVEQTYGWQVVLLCNPNSPSSALVTEADIEVVETLPALERELSATGNSRERANFYAEAGLWYDAFSQALAGTDNAATRELKLSLLKDLAGLEETGELANGNEQSARLRKVIEANGTMTHSSSFD